MSDQKACSNGVFVIKHAARIAEEQWCLSVDAQGVYSQGSKRTGLACRTLSRCAMSETSEGVVSVM